MHTARLIWPYPVVSTPIPCPYRLPVHYPLHTLPAHIYHGHPPSTHPCPLRPIHTYVSCPGATLGYIPPDSENAPPWTNKHVWVKNYLGAASFADSKNCDEKESPAC